MLVAEHNRQMVAEQDKSGAGADRGSAQRNATAPAERGSERGEARRRRAASSRMASPTSGTTHIDGITKRGRAYTRLARGRRSIDGVWRNSAGLPV